MSNRSHSISAAVLVVAMFIFTPLLATAFVLVLYTLPIYVVGYALVNLGLIASTSLLTSFKLGSALFACHFLWKLVRA